MGNTPATTTTMQAIVLLLSVTAFVTDAQTPVPVEGQATEQQNPPDPLGGEGTGVTGEGGEPAAVDAIGPGIGQGEMPRPELQGTGVTGEGTGVTDEGGVAPVGMKKIVAGEDGAVGAKAAGSEPTAVPADGGTGGGEARGAEPSEAQLADASVNPISGHNASNPSGDARSGAVHTGTVHRRGIGHSRRREDCGTTDSSPNGFRGSQLRVRRPCQHTNPRLRFVAEHRWQLL